MVAGIAGGRRLKVPPGRKLRPTSEIMREALFSSLASADALQDARVLDLFAGTGALGIEALSRGAASAVFVEADPHAVRTIRENLVATGLTGGTVVQADALRFVTSRQETFDLALVDPPYSFDGWPGLLATLPARLAALESGKEIDVGDGWQTLKVRRHGDSVVTLARCRREGWDPTTTE